jgi:thiosulfate/3-mercaptopyruvate sulfurtransferase
MYTTLISVEQLKDLRDAATPLMIFDCSFDLMNVAAGEEQYRKAHIPGAVYANLDSDLSDQGVVDPDGVHRPHPDAASGGRHPLPSREKFAMWLSSVGFTNEMQAVVYDRNGANYCGRLWWMLKWAGHEAVAVLDGGLQAWQAFGGEVTDQPEPSHFQSHFRLGRELRSLASTGDVQGRLGQPGQTLIDARAAARYRGEVEPLDPVAGHIPGALNRPFSQNLGADGRFKPAAQLKAEFELLLRGRDPATVVHQCGSGVSALPNAIAMEVAGLGPTALYAGSWSEWCSDPRRPVAKGDESPQGRPAPGRPA